MISTDSRVFYLEGNLIYSEVDFHQQIARLLHFGLYYGANLNALWDSLSDVERPFTLIWLNSDLSKVRLSHAFDQIIDIFKRTQEQDEPYLPTKQRFHFKLR